MYSAARAGAGAMDSTLVAAMTAAAPSDAARFAIRGLPRLGVLPEWVGPKRTGRKRIVNLE